MSNISFLHRFQHDVSHIKKPEKFTFPFCYEPHELSMLAAKQVQEYLLTQKDFEHNFGLDDQKSGLVIGKMFGVLVVEDEHGVLGYLAAVSGKLAGTNQHRYFVPPIFDMLKPEGFFLEEEQEINRINRQLEQIEENGKLQALKLQFESAKEEQQKSLSTLRVLHKQNKSERKQIRTIQKPILSEIAYQELEIDLIKQSYRDQHEYDVAKGNALKVIESFEEKYLLEQQQIEALKNERKERSSSLQQRLFDQYHFLNAQGESRSVLDIFQEAIQLQPPAGAGECAAPKLLQFAYQHKLKPIAMAEFWWGESPNTEVRKHLSFYPACRGKCEPILNHMLQGLEVDDNPMLQHPDSDLDIDIIYEDESIIVVNKPAEFLSVPGINVKDSVQIRILERFPEITGPLIIHRLDMSTSGILVLAKNKESHQFIQDQFIKHTVKKRYTAILDGVIEQQEGFIDLPLRVDLDDRPRQVVCYEYGKPAQTKFVVQAIENGRTRIHYFPLTGRTHQLRVHSAHKKGLFCPILGDDLYGQRADRLHLHAGFIEFTHPISKERISFTLKDPF